VMNSLEDVLKIMNPLQRAKILDFSLSRPRSSQLQGDDKIKSEFLAMVAHELRAPAAAVVQQLSVILGNMAGELNETQKQLIARAKDRTQGILALIRDLLDISKAEAGKMAQYREPLSLLEVLQNVVKMMETDAEQKNIQIECFCPTSPALVQADRTAMESLFTNLVSNAVKYTGAGGKVMISFGDQGNFVKVAVTDTGLGMKKEELSRIFDKFYRVKSSETRHIIGTGLGLAIVKNIVTDHHGSVAVESELGKGTTFSVLLPKAPGQGRISAPPR
jgi:two-component system phosphate regulon sensor histidine kinase PhoR